MQVALPLCQRHYTRAAGWLAGVTGVMSLTVHSSQAAPSAPGVH